MIEPSGSVSRIAPAPTVFAFPLGLCVGSNVSFGPYAWRILYILYRCTGCTELIPHIAHPYALIGFFVFSTPLHSPDSGKSVNSTIGPDSKRLLSASHSNYFSTGPQQINIPPIASILAPPRYPSPKHGKEKKDKIPTISWCVSAQDDTVLRPFDSHCQVPYFSL